ncbi:hypothetical protein NDU88_000727 [Pleurodeles waltl]|uniref:Uncharacterized protein n=1 Tax=Pleurodeles waltl TaxID=8319 RepID=A0AAV7USP4_PLEWA|nr:hypothetical protein NDU88_000727 [Pleurodeles waltl]
MCVYSPTDINDAFKTYYMSLYRQPEDELLRTLGHQLQTLPLGALDEEDRDPQGEPITLEEVKAAIKQLAADKTLGTGRLPMDVYKLNVDILAPKLVELYTEAYDKGILPETMREALVVPLPKTKCKEASVTDLLC